MTKHEEYNETLVEQCEQTIHNIFFDIEGELTLIGNELNTESSKILLSWVRDSIRRVAETYKV